MLSMMAFILTDSAERVLCITFTDRNIVSWTEEMINPPKHTMLITVVSQV